MYSIVTFLVGAAAGHPPPGGNEMWVGRTALVLSLMAFLWTTYVWLRQGPRVQVSAQFTNCYMGRDNGGNHFALQVTAVNSGRGSAQVVGWSLVSRSNVIRRPKWYRRLDRDADRWGVRHSWHDGPLTGSDLIPMRLEGNSQGTWMISLVDDPDSFPTIDNLIPDHEARIELEVAGQRRRRHSKWFRLPPANRRRSSHQIARDRGMVIPTEPEAPGVQNIIDHLVEAPEGLPPPADVPSPNEA